MRPCTNCEYRSKLLYNHFQQNRARKWVKWAENTVKINFSSVIFLNEFTTNLYGPDVWTYDWDLQNCPQPACIMQCQSSGSVMFLNRNFGDTILTSFQVTEGTEMNVQRGCQLLVDTISPWLINQSNARRRMLEFL